MGRAHNQKARDKNQGKLPQTPRKDINTDDSDLELAKELDDRYELKARQGFGPLELKRKE
ncbi:YfhD family protein [Bacillus alkalicellulosilyticus]|uniref:YfhD family protein n=1 Tax=Alkalihalobacterium alkalicellulosilyticum TaxID=1912214 RepID=UPI00099782D8|nr:YfhD family protein [Bacillus alkalicellulosilyticus]